MAATKGRRLVRGVLALANIKASSKRCVAIGYHSKLHGFTKSVDPGVTGDRFGDVLAAYSDPVPATRFRCRGVPAFWALWRADPNRQGDRSLLVVEVITPLHTSLLRSSMSRLIVWAWTRRRAPDT